MNYEKPKLIKGVYVLPRVTINFAPPVAQSCKIKPLLCKKKLINLVSPNNRADLLRFQQNETLF